MEIQIPTVHAFQFSADGLPADHVFTEPGDLRPTLVRMFIFSGSENVPETAYSGTTPQSKIRILVFNDSAGLAYIPYDGQ